MNRWEIPFAGATLAGLLLGLGLERLPAVAVGPVLAVHLLTYLFGSYFALCEVWQGFRERKIEVDLLMVVAAFGAASVGAWDEGATLLFLFASSNVLQHYAMQRTEQAVSALVKLRPERVSVRRGADLVGLPPEEVAVGEVVVLHPGERVALDGEVVLGTGYLDESALTGEPLAVRRGPGQPVLAGSLNQSGLLEVRVTRPAGESTLSRMVVLVSQARATKARSQTFLEVFEQRYAAAILLAVGAFIFVGPSVTHLSWNQNFYRAMTLLTVASPCALVIGVPAALLSALANAARHGVLLKGGNQLEKLAGLQVLAVDKTGTLTQGRPAVVEVLPAPGVERAELIEVAVRAERPSEHPLARAVLALQPEGPEPESFEAVPGKGVRARWEGVDTLVGSVRFLEENGLAAAEPTSGRPGSLLLVYRERFLGTLVIADPERPEVRESLAAVREAGIRRLVMLTGDRALAARSVAERLGIDEVRAELLPEDKLREVDELQRKYGPAAMVGDGINDGPALALAHVGVAMGAGGTDVALESADVVLMRDDLRSLAYALRLSRKTRTVVWQNIGFALSVMFALVVATLTVGIPLPLGVVGHEGSTILVVLNGLRLLRGLGQPGGPRAGTPGELPGVPLEGPGTGDVLERPTTAPRGGERFASLA